MKDTMHATLLVNGAAREVVAEPSRRLSDVLRTELGLTGTKVGCNAGDCGACTVLLDGRQVCSCMVSLGQAAGRAVTTVEGLEVDSRLRKLQDAFVSAGAAQCGICTPGMLMAAAEMALEDGKPSRDQIVDRMGGVLCRCTGYLKIVEAVEQYFGHAPALATQRPAIGCAVGSRMPRVDAWPRVSGQARYGADVSDHEALHLRVVRSPHAHARFRLGDCAEVLARHPGIKAILTAKDVPGNNVFSVFARLRDQPVFADGYVRYLGEAVAAIVGERAAVERFADAELPIEWQPLPPLTGVARALDETAVRLHAQRPGNVLMCGSQVTGDTVADAGAIAVEGRFETSFVEHAYIEPEAGLARRVGDRVELFVSTQAPYMNRDETAWVLGIEPAQVRIVPTAVGGGFGGKIDMSLQPIIAVAAWRTGRPVTCTYSRRESMRATTKRHPASITARLTCDETGRIASYEFHADFNTGPYASCGPIVADRVPIHAMGPYRVPAVRCTTRAVHTNDAIGGAFRGFGVPQAAIAHEALMDALADRVGVDRLEFRLRNALRAGDRTATGQKLEHSVGMLACLEKLAPIWREQRAEAEAFNRASTRLKRGVGIGCMWYGIGNTSQPNPSSMRVGVNAQGGITLFCGAVDIGQGVSTIMVQVCADALGVEPAAINLVSGDTDRTLDAGKSSASRQAFVSGNAVTRAAANLKAELCRRVGVAEGAEVTFDEAGVLVTHQGRRVRVALAGLPADAEGMAVSAVGRFDPPTTDLDEQGQGVPYASYAFGAQMALVEVDTELATVKVKSMWAAHDVGRAINPTQVEGQIHGGIAQGIGLALMEEYLPGRTDNLHDYLIPTFGDMPRIEILLVEDAEPLGPYGAKGVGEPALIPTAPAILGAIEHATGRRPTKVPVTPARLWALLHDRTSSTVPV
jgi:CO/xanthine dehydrogenase Mo-binding subunit/aerobic-type carbon monoxide dehydrogenase small subunit (CoxS/CutS family)